MSVPSLRALGNRLLVKFVNDAITAREKAAAQDFLAAIGTPSVDGAAGAVSGSPAVERAAAGSTTKPYSPFTGPYAGVLESLSKAREEVPAIQKVKLNSVGPTALDSPTTSLASDSSEHSLAINIIKRAQEAEWLSKGSAKTAVQVGGKKGSTNAMNAEKCTKEELQKKEKESTRTAVESEPAISGATEAPVGSLDDDGAAAESPAPIRTAGVAVVSISMDGPVAGSPAVDGAAALGKANGSDAVPADRVDARGYDPEKICWLCLKPEHAVELRVCRGCNRVSRQNSHMSLTSIKRRKSL